MRVLGVTAAVVLAAAGCSGTRLVSGAGGSSGTGGGNGLGGSPGTGGILNVGGAGGVAGTGGVNVTLCQQLSSEYTAVVNAAKGCDVGGVDQCQIIVSLDPHNCSDQVCAGQTYVNDGLMVEAARQKWLASCDTSGDVGCNRSACASPSAPPSSCVPTAPGSLHGSCMPSVPDAGFANPSDAGAGESCDQLSDIYAAVVSAARACAPGAPNQCQGSAFADTATNFCCPNFQVPVNDVDAVLIAMLWNSRCVPPCAGGICGGTSPTICMPVDGGTGGICTSVAAVKADAGAPKPLPPRCPGGDCDAGASRPLPPRCRGCDGGEPPDAGVGRPLPSG
jgi:hypothetical protein